jgi:hypothetical protein
MTDQVPEAGGNPQQASGAGQVAASPPADQPPLVFKKPSLASILRFTALFVVFLGIAIWAYKSDFLIRYKGAPYHDSRYTGGPQPIPGKVQCAFYDLGGEGVAYHDSDARNNGSGALNPADGTYLNEFRKNEGVDISYTKFHDQIDNSPFNLVAPPENQLYVGWTEPGEWFNMTVFVAHRGNYTADLLYTSQRGGSISIDVNGKPATGPLTIASTYNAADPLAWRQWHHWNLATGLAHLDLPGGKTVLTVHILTGGNMNLAYFDFKKARN